ncbi:MAG: hypothetical protein LC101_04520 [Flavobacteriales bacterium]|nr:hypothetical protein [Flavobacteriales bacterium]
MLQFLNHQTHPKDRSKKVFYYRYQDVFESMQNELTSHHIPFETTIEDDGTKTFYVIVDAFYFDNAGACNAKALSMHKKPFLADKALRIFILVVFFVATLFSLTGYIVTNFFK